MFWIDRIILWLVAFAFVGASLATQIVVVFLVIEAAWSLRALKKRDEGVVAQKTIEAWRRQYDSKGVLDGLDSDPSVKGKGALRRFGRWFIGY